MTGRDIARQATHRKPPPGGHAMLPVVRNAIAWIFGPGVGVWFAAAAVVLFRYRFGDEKQAQVQRILRRRDAAALR